AFLAAARDRRRTVQGSPLQNGLLGLEAEAALLARRLVAEEAVLLEDRLNVLLEADGSARGRAFLAPVSRAGHVAIARFDQRLACLRHVRFGLGDLRLRLNYQVLV